MILTHAGLPDAEVSDPSDPDEESDDEGSLRRKNMIVLRKRIKLLFVFVFVTVSLTYQIN